MVKEPMGFFAKSDNTSFAPLLSFGGEMTHRHITDIRRIIYRAAKKNPWLIIDLRSLKMISHSAVGVLLAAQRSQEERGGSIILILEKTPASVAEKLSQLMGVIPVVSNLRGAREVSRSAVKASIARERAKDDLLTTGHKFPLRRATTTLFNQFEA